MCSGPFIFAWFGALAPLSLSPPWSPESDPRLRASLKKASNERVEKIVGKMVTQKERGLKSSVFLALKLQKEQGKVARMESRLNEEKRKRGAGRKGRGQPGPGDDDGGPEKE